MAPVKNGRLIFKEIPTGYPEPGKTTIYDESETIDLDSVPLKGGVLVKTLVVSIDPYLRGKMRDPSIQSYTPAFVKDKPIYNYGVGVVLRSENPRAKPGDHLYGTYDFQQYSILNNLDEFEVLKNEHNLPWSAYVGVVGMPGQTAWVGWHEYAAPQKGDVVFVTAGAGPVGSFVIQLAKLQGLKVIASAGSEDKVDFIKSLGADVAFNYKTANTWDVLKREGPINIYWDNVGGETLDAALANAARGARFIECGMISEYNTAPYTVKNLMAIVRQELHLHGFIVNHHLHKHHARFYAEVPGKVARGEIKYVEDAKQGLQYAGEAILEVQKGRNSGKSVVIVGDE